jgi:hypothetical protein
MNNLAKSMMAVWTVTMMVVLKTKAPIRRGGALLVELGVGIKNQLL